MYYTYILYSRGRKRYYVGQTKDLGQRFLQHNQGRSKSTLSGIPWDMIYYFECKNRSEAIRLESRIKSRGVRRYLSDLGRDLSYQD